MTMTYEQLVEARGEAIPEAKAIVLFSIGRLDASELTDRGYDVPGPRLRQRISYVYGTFTRTYAAPPEFDQEYEQIAAAAVTP